jgi:hypothetical protein
MSNLFFFRDQHGYDRDEKIDRIKRQHVSLDNQVISEYVEEHDLSVEDLDDPGKKKLLRTLHSRLGDDIFSQLVQELYDEFGEEGDTFNIKAYELDSDIDEENLLETVEAQEQDGLSEGEFSYLLEIEDYVDREEEGVVDISFNITGKREHLSPDEILLETSEGGQVELDDVTDEPPAGVTRREEYIVEVRVYSDAGLLAISNSGVDKTLQDELRSAIQRWG